MNSWKLKILAPGDKKSNGMIWMILILLLSSCSPSIYYLGDSYEVTNSIDVYYDEKDVEKEYRTIGKMTHDKFINYDVAMIKEKMIKSAKEKGGDGIIFMETTVSRENDWEGDRLSITANVIKYKD